MIILLINCTIAMLFAITGLILAIISFTEGSKKRVFLNSQESYETFDTADNLRTLMLSLNQTEYTFGYRTEEEYTEFKKTHEKKKSSIVVTDLNGRVIVNHE